MVVYSNTYFIIETPDDYATLVINKTDDYLNLSNSFRLEVDKRLSSVRDLVLDVIHHRASSLYPKICNNSSTVEFFFKKYYEEEFLPKLP